MAKQGQTNQGLEGLTAAARDAANTKAAAPDPSQRLRCTAPCLKSSPVRGQLYAPLGALAIASGSGEEAGHARC